MSLDELFPSYVKSLACIVDAHPGDYVGPFGTEYFEVRDGCGGHDFIQLPGNTIYLVHLDGVAGFDVFTLDPFSDITINGEVHRTPSGTKFVAVSNAFKVGDEVTITRKRDDNR